MKRLKSILGVLFTLALLLGFGYILREFMRFPAEVLKFDEKSHW